jgi:hypothetical protein
MDVAIICEGKNDKDFLEKLFKHLEEAKIISDSNLKQLKFYILGGKSNVFDATHKKYTELRAEIERTQSLLFVVDADNEKNDELNNGFEKTQQGLDKIITDLGFQDVKTDAYIMCDPATKTGYLESLILSTISQEQRTCIECFLACSQFESKESHKAILNKIYNIAYPNAPYDFAHPHFDELKEKLCNLFTTNL